MPAGVKNEANVRQMEDTIGFTHQTWVAEPRRMYTDSYLFCEAKTD
ncbi:MAG: hypothetical protein K8R53_10680 [Bacteroidales bacterium]|nr:hypothetical protein [Bacteroidales bacterium]